MTAKARTSGRKRKSSANGSSGVVIPDALSKQDRIRAIAEQLMEMQREELKLGLNRTANGHGDDDPVPGLGLNPQTGQAMTYGERRAILRSGQMRLAESHRDLMAAVQSFINGYHAQQDAQG